MSSKAVPRQHYDIRRRFRFSWLERRRNRDALRRSRLLEGPEDRSQPAVAGFPQLLDVALVGALDAVDQRALLLGLEPLPRRELRPPALEGAEQLLQEQGDAPGAGGEGVGEMRARPRPAH